MSCGNWKSSYIEDFHQEFIEQWHAYRKENNLLPDVIIDGVGLNRIIAKAKLSLYARRPEARDAGYEQL